MRTALSGPRWAAVCLLAVLLAGPCLDAQAQFLPQEFQAKQIDANLQRKMNDFIDPLMDDLIQGDTRQVAEARANLIRPLENINASPEFKEVLSKQISIKMDPAVNNKDNALVRMNAMIVLGRMTDAGSMAHINAGLEDKSVAVQRKAMEALRSRVAMMVAGAGNGGGAAIANKLDPIVKQVANKLGADPGPHPIVVTPALQVLIEADTPLARATLNDQLNKRIDLHVKDPNLSYVPEQLAISAFAQKLAITAPFDLEAGTALNRAAFRYSNLVLAQLKANAIKDEKIDDALAMLNDSVLALGKVSAGARKQPPDAQARANSMIVNAQWEPLENLLKNDWVTILRAAPFSLTDEQLGVQ